MHDAMPPRSDKRVEGGSRAFGFVCPALLALTAAEPLVRFVGAGVAGLAVLLRALSASLMLLLGPLRLVSEDRVFRFSVEAKELASVKATGDGALLAEGDASTLLSSVLPSSGTAVLVEATGAEALREICDRR
jgi:hypothetical protein